MSATRRREILKTWIPLYSMLAPFFIIYILFTFIPIAGGVLLSFTDFNSLQFPNFIGLENFSRLFLRDEVFLISLKNTLFLAMIMGPTSIVLSFTLAWLIRELNRPLRMFIVILLYLPSLAGVAAFTNIMKFVFAGDSYGILNSILINSGLRADPINWLGDANYTMMTVLIVSIWSCFGLGFLSFTAGLQNLDKSYYEAAAIDGMRNRMQELYYVTLPQLWPQLMFSAVTSIAGAFTVGDINSAMTGNPSIAYSTTTLRLHMMEVGTVRFEMGYAATISLALFAMMQVTWSLTKKMLKRFNTL